MKVHHVTKTSCQAKTRRLQRTVILTLATSLLLSPVASGSKFTGPQLEAFIGTWVPAPSQEARNGDKKNTLRPRGELRIWRASDGSIKVTGWREPGPVGGGRSGSGRVPGSVSGSGSSTLPPDVPSAGQPPARKGTGTGKGKASGAARTERGHKQRVFWGDTRSFGPMGVSFPANRRSVLSF